MELVFALQSLGSCARHRLNANIDYVVRVQVNVNTQNHTMYLCLCITQAQVHVTRRTKSSMNAQHFLRPEIVLCWQRNV
jgi:hypothetical protein